jgi:hypothetical protein
VTTPQYPAGNLGQATNYINTNGGKIPIDVRPDPRMVNYDTSIGERTYPTDPADPRDCLFVEHNPRDGIASVIAFTQGEEGFVDMNGDGIYSQGEPFVDLGEPFVDSNDNNVQDGEEFFLDVNNNSIWDSPNGVWDSATTIWAETRIVYSGRPEYTAPGPPSPSYLSQWTIPLLAGESQVIDVVFADPNYSVLAPATVFSASSLSPGVSATILPSPVMRPCALGGFFFQRLFCDADGADAGTDGGSDGGIPANCASACPPLPSTKRCVVRSSLSSFEYGVLGAVQVAATLPGSFFVRAAVGSKLLDLTGTVCLREPDATFCTNKGANCGTIAGVDSCGVNRTVTSCGTCAPPKTCGGGTTPVPNVCGCTPETNAEFCSRLAKNCGGVAGTDNCGAARAVALCGLCVSPQTCGGGGIPNVCGP